jgi:hypothetical protein
VHGRPAGEESVPPRAFRAPRPSGARWMAPAFAAGSTCFLVGPFPGYLALVGPVADSLTFFVGSLLFTVGGALQVWLAAAERGDAGTGRAAWRTATIQFAGTIFFNITTFRAIQAALSDPDYDRLVWRPDAFGSACFLISGLIAYAASPRHGLLPARAAAGWWQPGINLLGCIFFGIAAIAGYVVPPTGSMLDLAAANWTTAAGAACFLVCALAGLAGGDEAEPPAAPHDRSGHLR